MSIYFLENVCYFSNMNNKLNFIFEVRKNSQAKTTTLLHFSASSLFGRPSKVCLDTTYFADVGSNNLWPWPIFTLGPKARAEEGYS